MTTRRDMLFGRFRRPRKERAAPDDAQPAREQAAPAPEPATPAPAPRRPRIPVLRPPGAVDEETFLAGCTKCGDCARACPYHAIRPASARMRDAAGTPTIDPLQAPCWMCEDAPCVEACEPGVLSWDGYAKMGTARIQEQACLAYSGEMCFTCSEHCPVDGAITLRDGKPVIDEPTCTGCGVCQHVCPAPANAILLMPSPERNGLGPMPETKP